MTEAFERTLNELFPGSMTTSDYLAHVRSTIEPLGFSAERTLPLVSICRDELTTSFFEQIELQWGLAFTLAGLGGVPALGRTGWNAALSHIPNDQGRGGVIVFGFPHIGIEADGSVGLTVRRNQTQPTPTCGALCSLFQKSLTGDLPTEVDFDDFEATRLAMRLIDPADPPGSLIDLTISALDALEIDVWRALDEAEVWRQHDVTVWCGVQIHGHDGDDRIWSRDAWHCGADGEHRRFPVVGTAAPRTP